MATAVKRGRRWRCVASKVVDGRRIRKSITADSKAEAEYLAERWAEAAVESSRPDNKTLLELVEMYIDLKRPLLSPTTVAEYERIPRNYFDGFWGIRARDLTQLKLQEMVSRECLRVGRNGRRISSKSVANAWGLVSSALRQYGYEFRIQLPERPDRVVEVLSPEVILPLIVGSSVELPCLLACWCGLTMSEIQGIRPADIRDGILYINRVVVQVDGAPVVKDRGKEEKRTRAVRLPAYILDLLASWDGTWLRPKSIYKDWSALLRRAGLPHMTFHQLRHVFATAGAMLDIPARVMQEAGGWKTPYTMQRVYQHTFSRDREAAYDKLDGFFSSFLPEGGTGE
jgi:integrase